MADAITTMFRLSLTRLNSIYDILMEDTNAEIVRMRALGISDEEIYNRLKDNLDNDMSLFQRFKGAVEKEVDALVGTTAQVEQSEIVKAEPNLDWVLDPTVQEHCPDCLSNAGKGSKDFEFWSSLGLPGAGNTQCGPYCKCALIPA